jgi:hypothetical protein
VGERVTEVLRNLELLDGVRPVIRPLVKQAGESLRDFGLSVSGVTKTDRPPKEKGTLLRGRRCFNGRPPPGRPLLVTPPLRRRGA